LRMELLCEEAALMARKPLRCRLGWHKWGPQHDADGERYFGCVRCHKRTDPGHLLPPGVFGG
jgi:hypothetical protein